MSKNIKDMLANLRPAPTPFHVKAWGVEVFIRALTESERQKFSENESEDVSHDDRIKSVCRTALVNPDGSPLYGDNEDFPSSLWFGGFSEIHSAVVKLTLGTFEQAKKS